MADKYIQLLKKAEIDFKSNSKIDFTKFREHCDDLDIKSDRTKLWSQIYDTNTTAGTRLMGLDAYFRLLEYEELKQARESSKEASRQALIAICIAAISFIASIIISIIQINCSS